MPRPILPSPIKPAGMNSTTPVNPEAGYAASKPSAKALGRDLPLTPEQRSFQFGREGIMAERLDDHHLRYLVRLYAAALCGLPPMCWA